MSGSSETANSDVVSQLFEIAIAYVDSGDRCFLIEIRRAASLADGPILVEYADSMAIWMRERQVRSEEARTAFQQGLLFGTAAMKDATTNQFLLNTGNIIGSTV